MNEKDGITFDRSHEQQERIIKRLEMPIHEVSREELLAVLRRYSPLYEGRVLHGTV